MSAHPWLELVPSLEAVELEHFFRDPEGLRDAMALRGQLIDGLAAADPMQLEAETRDDLLARLAQVLERDKIIMRALAALKDVVLDEMAKQNAGKRAMSGYKLTVSETPPPSRRIG